MYPKKIYILENILNKSPNIDILTNNYSNIILNELNFNNNIINIENQNIFSKNIIIRKNKLVELINNNSKIQIFKLNKYLEIKKFRFII